MYMLLKRILGVGLLVISIIIIFANKVITGAVIGTNISNSLSFVAVFLFIVGLVLTITIKKPNYAQEILQSGRFVDKTNDLKKIARKMGYTLDEGHKEGTRIYDGEDILTVIPNHRKINARGTVKSILEALASGESSFRRRGA
jgi:hypothetical protein